MRSSAAVCKGKTSRRRKKIMADRGNEKPSIGINKLRQAGWVLLALVLLGWLFPHERLWGIHLLAFLPVWISALLLLTAAVCFSPWGEKIIRATGKLGRIVPGGHIWVWGIIAGLVFVGLRECEPLLGDGQVIVRHLASMGEAQARSRLTIDRGSLKWKEPLETLLHETVYMSVAGLHGPLAAVQHVDATDRNPDEEWFFEAGRWVYIILSSIAGAVLVGLILRHVRRQDGLTAVSAAAILGSAAMQLFFGYIEDYSWISLATVAVLLSGLTESEKPSRFPVITCVMFVIALSLHLLALVLLPAVAYLVLGRKGFLANGKGMLGVAARRPAVVVGALAVGGYALTQLVPGIPYFLPLLPSLAADGVALFTIEHAADVVNILLLCAALPVAVVLLVRDKMSSPSLADRFLSVAAVGGVSFVIFFRPELGAPRDWDVSSLLLWPLVVLGASRLATRMKPDERFRTLAVVTGFTLLTLVPFVLVNAARGAAQSRMESILALDPVRAPNGWEVLATSYRRQGDYDGSVRALRKSCELEPNPRYRLNLAIELQRAGRLGEAEEMYLVAARMRPEYTIHIMRLCRAYFEQGNYGKVRDLARQMSVLDPRSPEVAQFRQKVEAATSERPQ
jgi:hypothetical protein